MKDLGKLYDRLRPEERVRAVLKAEARRDEQEVKRLIESCPRKTYSMADAAYTLPAEAALLVVVMVGSWMREVNARRRAFEWASDHLAPFVEDLLENAWHDGYSARDRQGRRSASDTDLDEACERDVKGKAWERVKEGIRAAGHDAAGELVALWRAADSLLRAKVGVALETALKIPPGIGNTVAEVRALVEGTDVDPKSVAMLAGELEAGWAAFTRRAS
jgi:hypothetical protein